MAISRAATLWDWLVEPPDLSPTPADRREVGILGLRLPARATVAILVTTALVLIDFSRVLLPATSQELAHSPAGLRAMAVERLVLWGIVPLVVVLVGFRDRPHRYGLTPGDARAGTLLVVVGCVVMTPIVLWFATLPDVRAYYAPGAGSVADVVVTNTLELTSAEFLFRGFLMLTLVRAIGPIGVLVAVMPFAFDHVGKPALELLSTLVGGLAYGWLAWRTRSIVWGSIAHIYIVTLVTLAAARP
jgi:membrane protease YdiL (CAAX protease family)